MNGKQYWKDKIPIFIINIVCMVLLSVFLFITSNAKKAAQVIESLFQTKNVKITDEYNLYLYDTVLPVAKINRTLIESGIDIKELHLCEETLEDYFKKITGGEGIA